MSAGMRVPPTGTSSAAFVIATSAAADGGYHQPHRISGAVPISGAARRGSSPTNIPTQSGPPQSLPYPRRGMDLLRDDMASRLACSPTNADDGGRGSPASSVHSWPDTQLQQSSTPYRHSYNHDHRYAQDPRLQETDSRFGPGFTVRFRDRKAGTTIELPNEPGQQTTYRSPHSNVTISTSRGPAYLPGYPPHVNLVTERLKRYVALC